MKKFITAATLATLTFGTLHAQTQNPDQETTKSDSKTTGTRFWEAKLSGGHYMVALNRISSISMHTYMVGNLAIKEVVIDTDGNSLVRFYAAESLGSNSDANIFKNTQNRIENLAREKASQAGVSGTPVMKDYPNTTHAKTVEFNVDSTATLSALYKSVKRAWERNRGTRFTAK